MTLVFWDIGKKKMKERTETSNLTVDHFSLTFINLSRLFESYTAISDIRIRKNYLFGVNTIISLAYIKLNMYHKPRQVNFSNAEAYSEFCQISKRELFRKIVNG